MVIIQAFEVKVLTHKLRRPHHLIVTYKFVLINLHEKDLACSMLLIHDTNLVHCDYESITFIYHV